MLNGIREGSAVPLEADLTTAKGCQALGDEIKQRESTVDVLINNSGVSWGSEMESTDEKKGWDRVCECRARLRSRPEWEMSSLLTTDTLDDRPFSQSMCEYHSTATPYLKERVDGRPLHRNVKSLFYLTVA